ncbi:MAG TPA: inositol monophosphatase family protein, partial [Citricoccus sp.]
MSSCPVSPAALRRTAAEAAAACAPRLAHAFRSTPAALDLSTKRNTHDLVTVHDRATEDELVRLLGEAVPGSRFVGEEGGARGPAQDPGSGPGTPGAPPGAGAVEWIIDPIDGTANFAHGFAMFSISIAAAVDGAVVAGVVLDPVNGLEFSADDAGAYLNGERFGTGGSGPEPTVPTVPEHALNLVTSYPSAEALALDGAAALERFGRLVDGYATVRRTVSGALELAYTAIGWADVTLGVDTNPWDVAAGQLLVRLLGEAVPGSRFVGEEGGARGPAQDPGSGPGTPGAPPGAGAVE